jgi:DNA topoisomerase-1
MKTLLIVESPAKSKTISKYLGSDYIVRASYGHILDLTKGGKGKDRLGVDIENGFKPIYVVSSDKKDKISAIVDAAKQVDLVLLAADKDREGENIAWCVSQQLKGIKVPIRRITFDEITKSALQKAIAAPRDIDLNLNDAQTARRVLDRLVGFMASPMLMSTLGPGLSAGRVQSVCLRMIVDREREIEAFVPEVYWNVTANLAKKQDKFIAKYHPAKITDEKAALKIKDDLENSKFTVSNIEAKQQKRNPNPPLTTSKLQQIAASIYKFAATRTMKAAQSLYEAGHVTYIRTDSVRSSPESIQSVREWIAEQGHDLPDQPNAFKNKGSAQDAHEAIRPTNPGLNKIVGLSDDEAKLYKLIWERFVASQMKPAIYDTVLVHIKASKGHELRANGRTLQYPGWLAITEDFDDADKNITLPKLKVGDDLDLVPPGIKSERKETQPPPRYTDGSIIKELEERGIGRPSTFAAILSKISDRNYVTKDKNQFAPTDLGRQVVDTLVKSFSFMEYAYTKDMESKLDKIEDGSVKYIDMMNEFFTPFSAEIKKAQNEKYKDGGEDCTNCGKRTILKHSKYGFFIACPDYPTCKFVKGVELDGDKIIVREKHKVIEDVKCPICKAGMVKRDGQYGPFYSCSTYPKCKGSAKIPFGKKCPQCSSDLYLTVWQGKPVLFCMGYKNGCRHSEQPEEGTAFNDPKKIVPKELPKKIKRHL